MRHITLYIYILYYIYRLRKFIYNQYGNNILIILKLPWILIINWLDLNLLVNNEFNYSIIK